MFFMEDLCEAVHFASEYHGEQRRKYTGEPYIYHPIAVCGVVQAVSTRTQLLKAAILHDVVEDTACGIKEIQDNFGEQVAKLVDEVTNKTRPEDGNRAVRKAMDIARLSQISDLGQTLKLADVIDNVKSVMIFDPKFAAVYLQEKRDLLAVMNKGNPVLYGMAYKLVRWHNE